MRRLAATFVLSTALLTGAETPAPAPAPKPPTPPATAVAAGAATPAATPKSDDRPQLGVQIDEKNFGDGASQGLAVLHVVPSSTAATIGVQIGDRITAINALPIAKIADLQTALGPLKIGDKIAVDVLRNGERKALGGVMQAAPNIRVFTDEVAKMRQELDEAKASAGLGHREPSLAEVLEMLGEIEKQLPKAVAEFKKQYPDGEFDIKIDIHIVSDKKAKNPVDLLPDGEQGGKPADGGKPTADPGAKPDATPIPPKR